MTNNIVELNQNEINGISGGVVITDRVGSFLDTAFALSVGGIAGILTKKFLDQSELGQTYSSLVFFVSGIIAYWVVPNISDYFNDNEK